MSRVPRVIVDPTQPQSIVEHLGRVQRVLDGEVEFGNPQDPTDPQSTTRANGVAHNGTVLNVRGSWFEAAVTALNTNVTCTHNLGLPIVSASSPNVRWLVFGWQHDGTGAGAGSSVSAVYVGGAVTTNSIVLRFFAAGRTVDVIHPLTVSLFFVPAVRA